MVAFLQSFVTIEKVGRGQKRSSSLLMLQTETVEGRRVRDKSQPVVCSMTSLIKGRRSEKCFSLVAAIYFLVLIGAPWQGFVKGNNEQL